jgi:hypothetical protein
MRRTATFLVSLIALLPSLAACNALGLGGFRAKVVTDSPDALQDVFVIVGSATDLAPTEVSGTISEYVLGPNSRKYVHHSQYKVVEAVPWEWKRVSNTRTNPNVEVEADAEERSLRIRIDTDLIETYPDATLVVVAYTRSGSWIAEWIETSLINGSDDLEVAVHATRVDFRVVP